MFSVMSVHHSVHGWRVPCDHYPWCIGSHHTGTSGLGPFPSPRYTHTSLFRGTHPQTYSNLFIMNHIQLASGRFASVWNTFLLSEYESSNGRIMIRKICVISDLIAVGWFWNVVSSPVFFVGIPAHRYGALWSWWYTVQGCILGCFMIGHVNNIV